MRTRQEQIEFERQVREYVRSGGRVRRYNSDVHGEAKLTSRWQTIGEEARKLNEKKKRKTS